MTPDYNPGFKPLESVVTRHGLTLRQVERTALAAIYSVGGRGLEVFQIKLAKGSTIPVKTGPKAGTSYDIPAAERYPSDEDFGKFAWYFMPDQKEQAYARYAELNAIPTT